MHVNISAVSNVAPWAKLERVRARCAERERERESMYVHTRGVLSCSEIRRLNLNGAAIRCLSLSFSPAGRRLITVNASRLISANVNASAVIFAVRPRYPPQSRKRTAGASFIWYLNRQISGQIGKIDQKSKDFDTNRVSRRFHYM